MVDTKGVAKKVAQKQLKNLYTAEPCIVISVDYDTYKCSVRLKGKIVVNDEYVDAAIIEQVPILVQKSGDSVIMLPPSISDVGLCVFSRRSLDEILIDNGTNNIYDHRRFSINDGVFVGGLFTELSTIPTISAGEMILKHGSGSQIKFSNDGNIYITG